MKEIHTSYGSIEGYLIHQNGKLLIESNVYQVLVPCTFPDDLLDKACLYIREKHKVYLFGLITQEMHSNPIKIEVTELEELPKPISLEETLKRIQGK